MSEKNAKSFSARVIFLFGIWTLLFTLLSLRLGWLGCSGELMQAARQQKRFALTVCRSRGPIYDCRLQPMTDTEQEIRYAVMPCPENQAAVLHAVPPERRAAVSEQFRNGRPFLLSGVSRIEAVGIEPFRVPVRTASPQPAPHLIGYLDSTGHGVCGMEKSLDRLLSENGAETVVHYQLNALGHPLSGLIPEVEQPPRPRAGAVLTLDSNIQKLVEHIGGQMLQKGAIVVMEPYTGRIRACASFPSYSLRTLSEAVQDAENTPLINRALLPYNVGSTFKVVTAAAALEAGIPVEETVDCTGFADVKGQRMRCHKRSGHGELGMIDAMMKSCNPYFIHLGLKTGGANLLEMAERFGFGEKLPLSGAVAGAAGTLPDGTELINPAAVANLSFGQGTLTASPLQITRMMAAACNGGLLVQPRLLEGTTPDGVLIREYPLIPARKILLPQIAEQLRMMLVHCVMMEEGQNAFPAGVTAGGKTATAQTGRFDAEGEELEHGWFSGFFPASAPRYVVTVLSENSGFGNQTAAPVFREIAEQISAHGW